jgi:DNA-binding Lrp family transcriptional regulator
MSANPRHIQTGGGAPLDATDRAIVVATQDGLPRVAQPYHAIAQQLGLSPDTVMQRLRRMQECGIIRRIGVVPNHYALGYKGNGMSVWDVADESVAALGRQIGDLDFVSHCYHRPRFLPEWRYNLFAMVHGRDRAEVLDKVRYIAGLLGDRACDHDVLFSSRILKKTGLRIGA